MNDKANEFLENLKPGIYMSYREYDFSKRKETFDIISKTMCPGFMISEAEDKLYDNGIKYFAGDESGEWDIRKGLYLYGKVGSGKTTFFKILNAVNEGARTGNSFKRLTSSVLIDGFFLKGFESIIDLCKSRNFDWSPPYHILLDDMGQSSNIVKHFGNETNIYAEFLQRRYINFTDDYVLTHISTNIEPDEIKTTYGEFIASRMREMFNIVLYPGNDKRK